MTRTLLVAPGRGSYTRDSLASLTGRSEAVDHILDVCDARRSERGLPTLRELDGADRFRSTLHVAGEHASLLTFAAGLADAAELSSEHDVVGVVGNSMGFYTALYLSGALSLEDAITLVDTMGSYQAGNVIGGQILYPLTGSDWRERSELRESVEFALASATNAGHTAEWSIELGGFAVLGADAAGVKHLLSTLPAETRGDRSFPVQLPLHSAFHTSLMRSTSERAFAELGHLGFRAPRVPLIDGRGHVFRPRWADPAAIRNYTLGHQVHQTFDLHRAVVTALQFCAPDVVVALGPGTPLLGPLARILLAANWRGVGSREDLLALADSEHPVLLRA